MYYQDLYKKYKTALKLRELSRDDNYLHLKEVITEKILAHISPNSKENTILYLSGMKEVFSFVEDEAGLVCAYQEQIDKTLNENTENME